MDEDSIRNTTVVVSNDRRIYPSGIVRHGQYFRDGSILWQVSHKNMLSPWTGQPITHPEEYTKRSANLTLFHEAHHRIEATTLGEKTLQNENRRYERRTLAGRYAAGLTGVLGAAVVVAAAEYAAIENDFFPIGIGVVGIALIGLAARAARIGILKKKYSYGFYRNRPKEVRAFAAAAAYELNQEPKLISLTLRPDSWAWGGFDAAT